MKEICNCYSFILGFAALFFFFFWVKEYLGCKSIPGRVSINSLLYIFKMLLFYFN